MAQTARPRVLTAPRGFRGAAGESRLRPRLCRPDTTTRVVQRVRRGQSDDNFVYAFVVLNPVGPLQVVFGADDAGADGTVHAWECRQTAPGELTFYPHPAYRGGPVVYLHGHQQRTERMYEEPANVWSFPDRPGRPGGGDHGPAPAPGERAG